MKTLFDRLHHYLAAHAPAVLADLRPGATHEQIRAAEQVMGLNLPSDLAAAYRIHDGQQTDIRGNFRPLLYGCEWLRLERVVEEWKLGKELHEQENGRYPFWRAHWIPLTFDGTQLIHFDTLTHQVIDAWEGDFHIAWSFERYLEEFLEDLEAGHGWVNETPVDIDDIIRERLL
jgi:cell wall assembly regulator SMI1